jgi:hypothetical protein
MEPTELEQLLAQHGLVLRDKGFEVKGTKTAEGRTYFTGIMSTDTVDRDGEVVDQKSLQDAMPAFVPGVLCFNHRPDAGGIGRIEGWSAAEHATLVSGWVGGGHDIVYNGVVYPVENLRKQVEAGILSKLSFGFLAARQDLQNGVFKLIVRDVLEDSLVTVPSQREAHIELAKALDFSRLASMIRAPETSGALSMARNTEVSSAIARLYLRELVRPALH